MFGQIQRMHLLFVRLDAALKRDRVEMLVPPPYFHQLREHIFGVMRNMDHRKIYTTDNTHIFEH